MNRNRLLNWRHGVLAAGLALSFGVAGAGAGPITINDDLDDDGNNEVAASSASQSFLADTSEGGTITFKFMFLTSEGDRSGSSANSVHDVFRMQLRRSSNAETALNGNQADGAVVRTGDSYNGSFAEYNFADDTIDGSAASDAEDSAITIPAGGQYGLSNRTVLTNGGIGWQSATFSYSSVDPPASQTLFLEFLVGGSDDSDYDSALFIADVTHSGSSGPGNGLFTVFDSNDEPNEWTVDGNVGVYDEIETEDDGTVTSPSGDGNIMVLSTSNTTTVPEPSTGVLLLGLAGLAATGRRRRR